MATASEEALRAIFEQIRDERKTHANTATRIGEAFLSLLSHLDNGTFLKQGDTESTEYILSVTGGASASLTKLFTLETVTEQGEERVTLATPLAPFKELELRDYLQIGDARLRWDSERQALYVIGKDGSTPVGFYSTGWLSAKGANDTQGEGGGGGGLSYSRLDSWEGYTEPDMEGWVLSAKLANDMYQDINDLKSGVAMSYAVQGTGNAITDVTRDGSRWVFTRGKTFSELWHTHPLADIYNLHSSWDAILKVAPSDHVTRWPTAAEVGALTQSAADSRYAMKTVTISAGAGLTGGGNLSANRTLSLAAVGTAGTYTKVTVDAYGRVTAHAALSAADIPTLSISKISGLQAALDKKLEATAFTELFEKVTLADGTTAIRAKYGLYSDEFLSAKGANDSEGGGGGGLSYSRLDSWEGYSDEEKGGWVLSAYLGVRLHQDIENLKNGVAMSYAVTGTGNAITDVTRDGSRWVFTKGKTFSELWHTHTLSDISNLHSSWDAILKVAPSDHVTRWPTAAEVGALTQSSADSRYALKTVTISAGAGLTGGGNLSANRTLSLAAVGTAGTYTKVTVDAYGRVTAHAALSAADIPSLSISKISGLQAALDKKLEATAFTELFEKVTLADGTTAIRAKYGLYSDEFLSAKGANDSEGGGGGGLSYSRLDSWEGYSDEEKGGWVLSAYLGVRLHQDISELKSGVAMSYAVQGTGNAITDVTRDGSRWVFTRGKTFSELGHTHPLANIYDLHSSWDAVLKAQKPNWLTAVSLATISDLHANWDAILKVAPSDHVTRWPTAAEVGALTQSAADSRYALKTVTISAGAGLTGGGNLSANRTLSLAAVGTAGTYTKVTVDAYGRVTAHASLSAADIPSLSISKISGLQAALDKKLEATAFTELFEKVNIGTSSAPVYAIRAKYGFYSDGFVSGKGANPSAGEGGGGAAYNRLDTWDGYSDALAGWVLSAGLGYSLYNDVKSLKQGAAVSLVTTGSGNAVTDIAKSGTKLTVTKGLSFLTAVSLATISDLHSSWDAALKAQKPNWLTAVSLATISDLHANWDALLKAAPSAYVTRWPNFSEVGNRPSTLSGYGIADGVNAVSVTGSGNAVSAASVSGHTLTLTKGVSALTAHQAIYALTLLGTGTTIDTYNPKSAAKTINLSAETLRMARGNVPPQTGRNQNYGWLYSYNCAGSTTGDRPSTYMSVVGFGRGTGGTVEIGGCWVSSMGLWYRALRDYEDDWYAWRKLLDSVTYTEYTVTKTGGGASGTWGIGISGNAATASKWAAKRTISLTGAVTGSVSLDGSGNVSLATTYAAANISALDSRYVNVSGDTMTGLLSLSSGSKHKGAKVGNVYVNAIDRALIIQNAKEIRFGQSDNWAYNDWGGLTYDHSKKYLYLGIADGTIFQQNAGALSGGSLLTPGIGNIFVGNNTSNKVWHAGNDGSGSGLDADTVDGTHKNGLFTAFSANGNSTRITIGGVTKDLTVPYASNADKLDGLQATSFMRCDGTNAIALTGGNGNTDGYRLVIQKTMTAWSINNLVFVVASRHNGQGILSVAFHITADSPSSYGYSIRYFGASFALSAPFRAFYNKSTHVFRLYWHYGDYTACGINVLRVEGFPSPSNGTWYEAMPSDNGTELTIEYNNADTIGGTSKSGLLTALSSSTGTNLSLTVGGTTKTVADLYATTAEKLLTARTLWGQSFNGTGNVSGSMTGVGSITMSSTITGLKGFSPDFNDSWSDGTNSHPWYGYDHRYDNTGVYSTTISDYFGMTLRTAGTNLSITSSGNVGIGTSNPSYKLHVAGTGYFTGALTGYTTIYAKTGMYSDGYVSAKGQNTSSDLRLKDVLGSVTLPLERIAKAPSFNFRWKDGSGESAGSSAQYWKEALPSAVKERGGYLEMQYGNIALLSAISIARETMRIDREVTRLREECRRLRGRVARLEEGRNTGSVA